MTPAALPSFRNPPLIETVLGVQFAPLRWGVPHFGLFWQAIRTEFEEFEVQPPLSLEIETFVSPPPPPAVRVELNTAPDVRCWFVKKPGDELIQVQKDRFLYNWRKTRGESSYPRYADSVRPAFERNWAQFTSFVETEKLGKSSIVQCEVTYVNHILKDEGWDERSGWSCVFRHLSASPQHEFLPVPESGGFHLNYRIPGQEGRLRVMVNQAVRTSDAREVIVVTMTARGKPASSQMSDLMSWFDTGHEWVVRGFADITSDQMHGVWGRES